MCECVSVSVWMSAWMVGEGLCRILVMPNPFCCCRRLQQQHAALEQEYEEAALGLLRKSNNTYYKVRDFSLNYIHQKRIRHGKGGRPGGRGNDTSPLLLLLLLLFFFFFFFFFSAINLSNLFSVLSLLILHFILFWEQNELYIATLPMGPKPACIHI